MSLTSAQLATLDDIANRLAGESVLAQVGSDEALVPAYSLLSDLLGTATVEALQQRAQPVHAALEAKLNAAQPFDEATLAELRGLVAWLPGAINAFATGAALPVSAEAARPAISAGPQAGGPADVPGAPAPVDEVLDLNLGENRELLSEFHSEALDHLQQIEAALLVLDGAPEDRDALNSLFRSFHTIKGVSGFLHLTPMHTLAHEVESLLDLARNRRLRLTPAIITEILRSRDAVQAMVHQITLALEQDVLPREAVPVAHLICAVRVLAASGEAPGEDGAEPASAEACAAVAEPVTLNFAPEAGAVPVAGPANDGVAAPPAAAAGGARATAPGASTVRVNTEKLDSLMDVVGELVIVQSQLQESARGHDTDGSPLARNLGHLSRITKELQRTAMALRMVPIKPTFQRMERLARDLSREFGKKVQFTTQGEDTEIDRTVVEEIADPLVHMVRNALDHGLEPPDERRAAGKGESGTLQLAAYHEGSNLVLQLTDDGRGIDPEKVLAKARRQGLVAADASLSRDEIVNLIFLPGFSTADKVTSVSGRGVGMDVVKRNLENLRGHIQIETEPGRGSTFRIRLPLTTAIIDGLLVRVGEDRFILPTTMVQMALKPERAALARIQGTGEALDHRGRMLPIHRLHRRFAIAGAVEDPADGIVVIVETAAGGLYALLVDELLNKQEVVVKNLGSFLQSLPGVAGGAILGDGNIALILDPASLAA